jgi:hypothetical protein
MVYYQTPRQSKAERLRNLLARCYDDPARFAAVILGVDSFDPDNPDLSPFWWRQEQASGLVARYHTTVLPWGNALGKSWWAARLILWYLCTRPGSLIITTAPTFEQLDSVLWKNIRQAAESSRIPLGLKINAKPLRAKMGEGWGILGLATDKTERMSGHHNKHLMAFVDEASDVPQAIKEAIDSLVPERFVAIGNPLKAEGWFRDLARLGEKQAGDTSIPDQERVVTLRVPSTDSPHIGMNRSPVGMACGAWIRQMEREYGRDSLWWTTHIDAQFPDASHDGLLKPFWVDRLATVQRAKGYGGTRRMGVDLGEGTGRDSTVIFVVDDLGILHGEDSNYVGMAEAAKRINDLMIRWDVRQENIAYDAGGGRGKDMDRYLEHYRITDAIPYLGSGKGGKGYTNKRSRMAFKLRFRLDPERRELPEYNPVREAEEARRSAFYVPPEHAPGYVPGTIQPPFALPHDRPWWPRLADELKALRYSLDGAKHALETKEEMVKRLGRSPDLVDALMMSFVMQSGE